MLGKKKAFKKRFPFSFSKRPQIPHALSYYSLSQRKRKAETPQCRSSAMKNTKMKSTIHGRCQKHMKYHSFVFFRLQSYTSRIFVTGRQLISFNLHLDLYLSIFSKALPYFQQQQGKNIQRINKLSLVKSLEKLCGMEVHRTQEEGREGVGLSRNKT